MLFILSKKYELYSINSLALEIFDLILKKFAYKEILDRLLENYNVEKNQLVYDVECFINNMVEYEILE